MTDKEIADNLNEIRLEKALAAELTKTEQIIKRTGMFDPVDNIYGEIGAEYQNGMGEGADGGMGSHGGGGFGGGIGGFGGGMDDLGAPGSDAMGDIGGMEGTTDMGGAPAADSGTPPPPMEATKYDKPLILETKNHLFNAYVDKIRKSDKDEEEKMIKRVDIVSQNLLINEETQSLLDSLSDRLKINENINIDE